MINVRRQLPAIDEANQRGMPLGLEVHGIYLIDAHDSVDIWYRNVHYATRLERFEPSAQQRHNFVMGKMLEYVCG